MKSSKFHYLASALTGALLVSSLAIVPAPYGLPIALACIAVGFWGKWACDAVAKDWG